MYSFDYPDLLNCLAETQPSVFLDVFLANNDIDADHRRRIFSDTIERVTNPLSRISDSDMLSWCDIDPTTRGHRRPLAIDSTAFGRARTNKAAHLILGDCPVCDHGSCGNTVDSAAVGTGSDEIKGVSCDHAVDDLGSCGIAKDAASGVAVCPAEITHRS